MSQSDMNAELVLQATHLTKDYLQGPEKVSVLTDVNLSVASGQQVAIVGASGAGKSTLLNLLGGLDTPSSGDVHLAGQNISGLSENRRGLLRNQHLGFVYQFHHLLPEFSALENVMMPLRIGRVSPAIAKQKAAAMLQHVGLEHRLGHRPAELSGGERQRVAIARALVNEPACVLMDEPTGNLDRDTAQAIRQLLNDLVARVNTSFVIVTHDPSFARSLDKIYELSDGHLIAQQDLADA